MLRVGGYVWQDAERRRCEGMQLMAHAKELMEAWDEHREPTSTLTPTGPGEYFIRTICRCRVQVLDQHYSPGGENPRVLSERSWFKHVVQVAIRRTAERSTQDGTAQLVPGPRDETARGRGSAVASARD